ncbi:MAG: ketopantoate reductase family protein [Acidobacteriaceae bacterium]|nr:ketopantoate reductase family protein [Acidobacteriaceae bacterium]
MRILVIGAGATGGFYGGKLALAGRDVTFLVRGKRAEQLRQNGMTLRTPTGEQHIAEPKLITAAELANTPAFDLILLAVKAYGFAASLDDFAAAVGPDTLILPLLNGMSHLAKLDARFGREHVLGGLCRIVGDIDPDTGAIVQMTPLSDIAYGERDLAATDRIRRVDETMQGAGFHAILAPDINASMWVKWMLLASTVSINVLGRGTIGEIEALDTLDRIGFRFQNRVIDEAASIATANGYAPDAASETMIRKRLTEKGANFTASLYRDLTRGFPVEADQIIGDILLAGREKGVDTPLIEAAYVQLKVHEARQQRD